MLAIARDVGYSETAFVLPNETATIRVRYFSPLAEVAFCGHATVATAVALADRDGPGELDLVTLAGPIRVTSTATDSGMVATLTSPATRTRPVAEKVLSEALAAIGWEPDDLDPTYPPHVAFAGNDHLVLGVTSLATLAGLDYDFDRLAELMRQEQWTTVHLFFGQKATASSTSATPSRPAVSSRTPPPAPRPLPSVATCARSAWSLCPRD